MKNLFVKKTIAVSLLLLLALTLLSSCSTKKGTDNSTESSASTESVISVNADEIEAPKQKEWTYSRAESKFAYIFSDFDTNMNFYQMWFSEDSGHIESICDDKEYIATTIIRTHGEVPPRSRFMYLGDETIKYVMGYTAKDGYEYNVIVGVIPDRFRGKNAEELLRDASDYYEVFDMKSGQVSLAGETIDYVYHDGTDRAFPSAIAVFKEKWFIAIRPAGADNYENKKPEALFNELVFSEHKLASAHIGMIGHAIEYSNEALVIQVLDFYDPIRNTNFIYKVYDGNGDLKAEISASSYYPLVYDKTHRIWKQTHFYDDEYSEIICNVYGETLPLNSASNIIPLDSERGEFLGIIDGKIYIFDGDGKQEEFTLNYTSVKKLGNTEAVKFNDAIYALIQDGKFVRLYETLFEYRDAALEYNEELKAILIGHTVITEIVNRYGEIVEAFWYDVPAADTFTKDKSEKYVLATDSMSLSGNTYILDFETLKPIADLPNSADYKFTSDGKLLISYTNLDTDEYVEFKVDIESAVRNYAYDPEYPDCDCFDGFPTEEDFK